MNEKHPYGSEPSDPKQDRDSQIRADKPESAPSEEAASRATGAQASQKTETGELAQIRRAAHEAKFQAEQQGIELQQQDEKIQRLRRRGWLAGVAMLAILAGLAAYSYPLWKNQAEQLDRLPGMQQSLTAIGQRVDAAEQKLSTWASAQSGWIERLGTLEKKVSRNLLAARKQAEDLAAQVHQVQQTLQAELTRRAEEMEARLSWLETSQETDRIRLAKMEEEIGNVRQETTRKLAQFRQETGRDLERLDQETEHNGRDIDSLSQRLDRSRVSFEVTKNRTQELVPGVSVTITRTDVSYQFAKGWIRLVPEGRTLWLVSQNIRQPVFFYRDQGERPYELVFTRVAKDGVVGYLLVPGSAEINQTPVAQSESPAPSLALAQ